ncbi:FAD:protein FMN transferase [Vibrio sp. WJH972]
MKVLVLLFVTIFGLVGCEQSIDQVHLSGPTMGTTYNVKYLDDTEQALEAGKIQTEIDRLLEQVNDQMSTYRKSSELSLFNQYKGSEPYEVSPEMVLVVQEAIRLNHLTQGALDVTVGPLVNLWGFGPEARPDVIPTDEDLTQIRKSVGIEHLQVNSTSLSKDIPDLYVDLSTIAKGWGVDVVAQYLQSLGLKNYMVEIGGEIRLRGKNQQGVGWRIAIEKPVTNERAIQEIIEPGNMGLATSGDYRNYFEENGIRYSHIIDPKTGRPISNKVVSVTVLDSSTMTADGLATGIMVMGEVDGMALAEENDIPVFMVVKTQDGYKELSSSRFKPYLNK